MIDNPSTYVKELRRRALRDEGISPEEVQVIQMLSNAEAKRQYARDLQREVSESPWSRPQSVWTKMAMRNNDEDARAQGALQRLGGLPYGQTMRQEPYGPQELVNEHVAALLTPNPALRAYERGKRSVGNEPGAALWEHKGRLARDAALTLGSWLNPVDWASMFTDKPIYGSFTRTLQDARERERKGMRGYELGREEGIDAMLGAGELGLMGATLPSMWLGARSGLSSLRDKWRGWKEVPSTPEFMREVNPRLQLPAPRKSLAAPEEVLPVPDALRPPAFNNRRPGIPWRDDARGEELTRLNNILDDIMSPRPPREQTKILSPWGQWMDDVPTQFRRGGLACLRR